MSWEGVLQAFDAQMEEPEMFGWFHMAFLFLAFAAAGILCLFYKNTSQNQVRRVVFCVAVMVIVLEIYKQINYSFTYGGGTIVFQYQWYAFPWQFCSMPMYVGFLAGVFKKGKVHDSLCAFLATYTVFAGLCVMFYPATVFVETIGINIQTMICHGSMITVGLYLLYTGHAKLEHKTILKAIPVFLISVISAVLLNEAAFCSGLLENHEFNMFFISPYCDPSLPVYSLVQRTVAYPWCLFIYVLAFTLAAYLVLLIGIGIKNLSWKHLHKKQCVRDKEIVVE